MPPHKQAGLAAMTLPPTDSQPARRWRFGTVELDERSLVLKIAGRVVAIEPKPLEALICLLERAGEVVTKDALMRAAWPGRIIADVTLAKTIARLRETLGDRDQSLIKTHHRYGYRLVAPLNVEMLDRATAIRDTQDNAGVTRHETEHRPLTVLFCDLVESTKLVDSLEPEMYRDLLVKYQRRAAEICARYEGHLAPHAGDGLLMYFGYPAAHDDDAERALRCACELITAQARSDVAQLALRVGVHTSTVLIGCTDGGSEPLATGSGLYLAARLQAMAEPDTVLMSEATYRLVPGLFVTRDFGPHNMRGLSEPVRVHQAIQPSGVRSRLEAAAELTPYAGREQEIKTLEAAWQAAVRGEGRALLISGEPGLGKSRLLLELRARLSDSAHTWLECRATALTRHSTWQPWVELLRGGLSLREADSDQQRLQRLEHSLDSLGLEKSAVVPLLAPLLNFDPAQYTSAQLGPELKRRRTLEALVDWVLHSAQQQPLVLVFEDLHWADDSSLDCLGLLLKQLADMPVLLLMTARTEFVPRWLQHSWLEFQTLDPLPSSGVEHMLATLSDGRPLSPMLRALVHERSGGVPLFVEELTRALFETEVQGDADAVRAAQAIPTSLRALLMARLDRLGTARELAQVAAVVGREVSHALLARVAGIDDKGLRRDLQRLGDSGLLHARGTGADTIYTFKHALIQDAAYETLVKSRRQELHGLIAKTLEAQFPERARNEPEVLALHFEKAGHARPAVRYGSRAASKAMASSAYREVIQHAEHALQLLSRVEDGPDRRRDELELLVNFGSAKLALLGRGHPELLPILSRTQALCTEADDTELRAPALANIAWMQAGCGNYPEYSGAGSDLVELARKTGNKSHEGAGHVVMTIASFIVGQQREALRHSEQAIALFGDDVSSDAQRLLGYDGPAAALSGGAIVLWILGYPDRAMSQLAQALGRAESVRHEPTLSSVRSRTAWAQVLRREPQQALEQARAAAAHGERYGFDWWHAFSILLEGMACGMLGRYDEGLDKIRCYLVYEGSGRVMYQALGRGFEAQVCLWAGRTHAARAALDSGFGAVEQYDERNWEAELHRLRGELLLAEDPDDTAGAEACFCKALDVSRSQEARSLELRAAISLARLWLQQDRAQDADALLRPVHDWFTEGFDTPDLMEAAALLDIRKPDSIPSPPGHHEDEPASAGADLRARALVNLALMHGGFGDYSGYRNAGQALLKLGQDVHNKSYEGVGHTLMSQASHMVGALRQSHTHSEQALRAFELDARTSGPLLGIDGPSAARLINATVLWVLGHPDQALEQSKRGWRRAESTGHPQTISASMSRVAWVHLFRREPQIGLALAQAGVAHADRYGYSDWKAFSQLQEGIAKTMLGQLDDGRALIRGYAVAIGAPRALYAALCRTFEAQACLWAGEIADARVALGTAMAATQRYDERHWEAETHRLDGELQLVESPDDIAGAEICFRQALDISRRQEARSLELRAATSLARLWRRTGRWQESDNLLRPVCAWFTEGFDTPDFVEANILLASPYP